MFNNSNFEKIHGRILKAILSRT